MKVCAELESKPDSVVVKTVYPVPVLAKGLVCLKGAVPTQLE